MTSINRNYRFFLVSNLIFGLAWGIFGPYWVIYLKDFGESFTEFTMVIGISEIARALTPWIIGKISDKIGRKPLIIGAGFTLAIVVFFYSVITTLPQLIILQIINGMARATQGTMETAFLADNTEQKDRGAKIGSFDSIVIGGAAVAMILSGLLVDWLGDNGIIIFYITSAVIIIHSLLLFPIKEKK